MNPLAATVLRAIEAKHPTTTKRLAATILGDDNATNRWRIARAIGANHSAIRPVRDDHSNEILDGHFVQYEPAA